MSKIRAFLSKLIFPNTYSNQAYVHYLRKRGARIGENTRFIYPRKCHVDIHRAEYITIGNNCCLSQVRILAHDYSWYVLKDAYDVMVPDPGGEVIIGNNCFIGYEALLMKNTRIGDNVIIGARSVVSGGVIPSNTVWAGTPARQICTLAEYMKKRKAEEIASIKYRLDILEKRDSYSINDFGWFMLYFLPRTEYNYDTYIRKLEFNGIKNSEKMKEYFFSTVPMWNGYDELLKEIQKYQESYWLR